MKASITTQAHRRVDGIGMAMSAGGRKARDGLHEAAQAMHRSAARVARTERRMVSSAARMGGSGLRGIRGHPILGVAVALGIAGAAYLLARKT